MDIGWATPIAYETWTITRLANPPLTNDLATHRAAYAADLSTKITVEIS